MALSRGCAQEDRGGGEGGYGCPTTTIDSGPPPVGEVAIKAVVVFAAVMFAFKTETVLDPLFATYRNLPVGSTARSMGPVATGTVKVVAPMAAVASTVPTVRLFEAVLAM